MKMNHLTLSGLLAVVVLAIAACQPGATPQPQAPATLTTTHIHPTNGYSQVVVVNDGRTKTLYVSGQIGDGETLAQQMESALANMEQELQAAGATMKDVVKMNTYIVDYTPEDLDVFRGVRQRLMGNENMPASTLVGVTALALPQWLIEIEAVAVVPAN